MPFIRGRRSVPLPSASGWAPRNGRSPELPSPPPRPAPLPFPSPALPITPPAPLPRYGPRCERACALRERPYAQLCVSGRPLPAGAAPCRICRCGGSGGGGRRLPCGKCVVGAGAGFTPRGISSCGGGQGGSPRLSMPLLPPRSALPALLRVLSHLAGPLRCPSAPPSAPLPAATLMDGPQAEALLAPLRQAVRHQVTEREGRAERRQPYEGGNPFWLSGA